MATHGIFADPQPSLDTTIHQLADRRVIIEHAHGIQLPDPPERVVRPVSEPQSVERFEEMAAEWRAQRASHPFIHAGATIYRLPDGRSVTHVTNWCVNNGPRFSFWSSADFSLIAQPAGFTHATPDGEVNYTILLFWSSHDVAKWQDFSIRHGHEYAPPALPEFREDAVTWIPDESKAAQNFDAATERAITHVHEHYQQNLAELKKAYAELEAEREARRAELEANPPQPRDIHLRVSRLDPAQAAAWHQYAIESKGGDK